MGDRAAEKMISFGSVRAVGYRPRRTIDAEHGPAQRPVSTPPGERRGTPCLFLSSCPPAFPVTAGRR